MEPTNSGATAKTNLHVRTQKFVRTEHSITILTQLNKFNSDCFHLAHSFSDYTLHLCNSVQIDVFLRPGMFDIIVKWQDNSVNLCSLTDFWLTKPVLVTIRRGSTTEETARITKIINKTTVEITRRSGDRSITDISDLSWVNRNEFTGVKLQWAADSSWHGEILAMLEEKQKFNPKKHLQCIVEEKGDSSEKESSDEDSNSQSNSDDSELLSSEDEEPLTKIAQALPP